MKKIGLVSLLIMFVITTFAREIVVEKPLNRFNAYNNVVIDKIVLNDSATVLYMSVYHSPKDWIRIDTKTYIRANGQKHVVKSALGIELGKEVYSDKTGRTAFTLAFDPIDPKTKELDFIESDCDDCFKTWGVQLQANKIKPIEIPKKIKNEAIIKEDGKSLEIPVLKSGIATFKGQLAGYIPELNWKVNVYVNNPVTGIQEEKECIVNQNGNFEIKIPLVTTMQVLFRLPFYNKYILLSPQKESSVYINLEQKNCQSIRDKEQKCPPTKYIYFGGANSSVNNQLEDIGLDKYERRLHDFRSEDIVGMTPEQYKEYILNITNKIIDELSQKGLTKKAFELACLDIRFTAMHELMFGVYNLRNAYLKANKLDRRDPAPDYKNPVFDANYYSFLKDFSLNNPVSLYSEMFGNVINSCKYINLEGYLVPSFEDLYKVLVETGKLSQEEKEFLDYAKQMGEKGQDIMAEKSEGEKLNYQKKMTSIITKCNKEFTVFMERWQKKRSTSQFADILGTPNGIAFDLMKTQAYCRKFQEYTPLEETELIELSQIKNPFFYPYVNEKNKELLAAIEKNKEKKGYNIHEVSAERGEEAFTEIVKKFEGKVILFDFWATWCGPCRSAMKQFEPAKKELKEKGVVFIYLTDESSPVDTWKNMIPDISGEHYRLTNNQFKELREKYGADGVPSYLILDKKGEKVYFKVGFEGPDAIKNKLESVL